MSDARQYDDMPRAVFITDKMSRFRQRLAATFLVNESSKLGSNYYAVTLEEWEGVSKDGPYLSLVVALSSNPTKADPPVEGEPEDGRWFKIDEAKAAWDEYRNIVSSLKDLSMEGTVAVTSKGHNKARRTGRSGSKTEELIDETVLRDDLD